MAVNYNNNGTYLGYFNSLNELVAKYNGFLGCTAIVDGVQYYHDGNGWCVARMPGIDDQTDIKAVLASVTALLTQLQTASQKGIVSAQYSYSSTGPFDTDVLTPSATNTHVWRRDVTHIINNNADEYQVKEVYGEPYLFMRYTKDGADGTDGLYYEHMFRLSEKGDDATRAELYKDLLKDGLEADGWSRSMMSPTAAYPYVLRTERSVRNGVASTFSIPIVYSRLIVPSNPVVVNLSNEYTSLACDNDGTPIESADALQTVVRVYNGTALVTDDCNISCEFSKGGGDLTFSDNVLTFVPTDDTDDNNIVEVVIRYNGLILVKEWTINKVRCGADGDAADIYELALPHVVVKTDCNGKLKTHDDDDDTQLTIPVLVRHATESITEIINVSDVPEYSIQLESEKGMLGNRGKIGEIKIMETQDVILKSRTSDQTLNQSDNTDEDNLEFKVINEVATVYPREYLRVTLYVDNQLCDIQTIAIVRDGKDGADGADANYEEVKTWVHDIVQNDERFTSIYALYNTLKDSDGNFITMQKLAESIVSQTAQRIILEVRDELKKAGIYIDSNSITLEADKIKLKNGLVDLLELTAEGLFYNKDIHARSIITHDGGNRDADSITAILNCVEQDTDGNNVRRGTLWSASGKCPAGNCAGGNSGTGDGGGGEEPTPTPKPDTNTPGGSFCKTYELIKLNVTEYEDAQTLLAATSDAEMYRGKQKIVAYLREADGLFYQGQTTSAAKMDGFYTDYRQPADITQSNSSFNMYIRNLYFFDNGTLVDREHVEVANP